MIPIPPLEATIAATQLAKSARRIEIAKALILRDCGLYVKFSRPATEPHPSQTRSNVYRVEGVEEPFVGVEELRGWLFERGVERAKETLTGIAREGGEVDGYKLSLTGSVSRRRKGGEVQA